MDTSDLVRFCAAADATLSINPMGWVTLTTVRMNTRPEDPVFPHTSVTTNSWTGDVDAAVREHGRKVLE